MLPRLLPVPALLVAMAGASSAQAPLPVPFGCPIPNVIENNSGASIAVSPCQPIVTDGQGNLVFVGACLASVFFVPPGEVFVGLSWSGTDTKGDPVPPGPSRRDSLSV